MNEPRFSVIIPTYNRGHMITETLTSVQQQSFKDWECILVDDGSTDNTKEVVATVAACDKRIKYVYQENAERSVARNNGIRHASGEYICFLDSDDQYCSDYLDELSKFIFSLDNPKSLIISDFYRWENNSITLADTPSPQPPISHWFLDYPVTPTRACVQKNIFKEFMFREDILIVEDTVLWLSISTCFPVHFLPLPLVKYRMHDENSVNRNTDAWVKREAGLRLFFDDPLSYRISRHKKKDQLATARWRIAEYYALNGLHTYSIWHALMSITMILRHRHTKTKLFLIWQNLQCLVGIRTSVSI